MHSCYMSIDLHDTCERAHEFWLCSYFILQGSPIVEEDTSQPENKEKKQRRMSRKRSIDVLDDSLDKLSLLGSADKRNTRRRQVLQFSKRRT